MTGTTYGGTCKAAIPVDASGPGIRACITARPLATGLSIRTAGPAALHDPSLHPRSLEPAPNCLPKPPSSCSGRSASRGATCWTSGRRIERQRAASGAAFVVLGIVIGAGGLWFRARLRAIAADARIAGHRPRLT